MKKYFVTGLIFLLPLALTYLIVAFIINILTAPFVGITSSLLSTLGLKDVSFLFFTSDQIISLASHLLILIFLFIFILAIGAVGRYFFFNYIIKFSDSVLHKIPLISSVYKTSKELIQTILTTSNKSFKQVVMVPFPTDSSWSIGLVTRDEFDVENRIAVFVPTTPNPTSGFLIMCDRSKTIPLDMSVEEALRYVISCGVLLTPMKKDGIKTTVVQNTTSA